MSKNLYPNFENHLGLVGKCAKEAILRYDFDVEDFDDIFQIGCIGLMKACQRASTDQNFVSYAATYIRGEILRHLRSLIGRKENGYAARKPHYKAYPLDSLENPDQELALATKGGTEVEVEDDYLQVKEVWFQRWEHSPLQRICLEMVILQGKKKKYVADTLNINPMKVTRNTRSGLDLLKKAYLSKMNKTELDIFSSDF